jgi:hypothetical protein
MALGVVDGLELDAQCVEDRLDEARAFTVAGCGNGFIGRGACRQHIAPIDLLAGESGGDRLLRQRFATSLQSQRYRYGPLIVGGDEHDRQIVHASKSGGPSGAQGRRSREHGR